MQSSVAKASTANDHGTEEPFLYEVLYYKRTNKVHKSKGVAKLDGILRVEPPPKCIVTLSKDHDGNNDDSDEGRARMSQNRSCRVWSGINREISKHVFGDVGLSVDETVILPQYECQIVTVLQSRSNKKSSSVEARTNLLKRTKQASTPLVNRTNVPKAVKRILPNTKNPSQPRKTISWQSRRIPPRQPQPQAPKIENEEIDAPTVKNVAPRRRIIRNPIQPGSAACLSKTPKKRKISQASKPVQKTTGIPEAPSKFQGAIGNLIVPASVSAVLRPHQLEGVAFLWNCFTGVSPALRRAALDSGIIPNLEDANAPKGCILADEMGLGKTLMTISTIFALHRKQKDHRFIVVCPSSLVSNWSKEFDKWIGKASQPKRVVIRKGGEEGLAAIRSFVPVKPHQSEVLIVSYDLFRRNESILKNAKKIGLLCVDEGHRLKNTGGSLTLSALNALSCEARLLITGTPIQNNLSEFYNVANFVCPGILGDLQSFRRVYERPINGSNNKNSTFEQRCKGHAQSTALENITKTFMLRRLQKDILKTLLPPRSEVLLFCRPSRQQRDIYKELTRSAKLSTNPEVTSEALTVLTKLRKICSHPSLLESSSPAHKETIAESGKFVVLEGLLKAFRECSPQDKVVIVSNFTSTLSIIESLILKRNAWSFLRLDGSTDQSDRQRLVDSFNRGSSEQSFAFLLSSKAGGCGLNLIGANRLIMVDGDWNPATDMQAMARVYRQGQTKPCFLYRLFTSGTVEEVIYQRQYQKGNLANLTVDGKSKMNNQSKGFTKDELRDCFTLKEDCACDTKVKVGARWPKYTGVSSLQSQRCADEALLVVAENEVDALGFVHIVDDTDEPNADKLSEQESTTDKSDYSSSEDENEFDG